MKYLITILFSSFLTMNVALADDVSDTTRRVIEQLFEAFNRHDTNALVKLYADDAELLSPGDIAVTIGKDAVRTIYDDHFTNIPAVHDSVQGIVAEGEHGAVEFIASWDQPTDENPSARGHLRIATFITVKNGKIVRDITYFDRIELAQNMDLQ